MIRALDLEVSSSPCSPVRVARAVRASGVGGQGVGGVRAVVPVGFLVLEKCAPALVLSFSLEDKIRQC